MGSRGEIWEIWAGIRGNQLVNMELQFRQHAAGGRASQLIRNLGVGKWMQI